MKIEVVGLGDQESEDLPKIVGQAIREAHSQGMMVGFVGGLVTGLLILAIVVSG